jgi:hypothetical protein
MMRCSLLICLGLLAVPVALAEPFSGYVAIINEEEFKSFDTGNLTGIENVAEGEAMISETALSFKAGVVYDNFRSDQEYFDGTIDILLDGGDVITTKFIGASISKELDDQGFFPILPTPVTAVIMGGKGAYKEAVGSLELRGRILPGGHGPTFFNFDGEIVVTPLEQEQGGSRRTSSFRVPVRV